MTGNAANGAEAVLGWAQGAGIAPAIGLYRADAFADRALAADPAAVTPLAKGPPAERLLTLGGEDSLSETAFCVRSGDGRAAGSSLDEAPLTSR